VNPKRISDGDGVVMVMVLVLVMVMERSSFGVRLFRWSTRANDVCFSWTQPGPQLDNSANGGTADQGGTVNG
jgi:hypothetical protein